MKHFLQTVFWCRRTLIAIGAIGCLTALGLQGPHDVSGAIAAIAMGLAAANSYERSSKAKIELRYGNIPPAG